MSQPRLIPEPPLLCGLHWRDGWGEHDCCNIEGHTNDHRCECDITVSHYSIKWREEQS